MAADYNTAAALLIVAGYNKPAVAEQIGNWVLTSQGKDAKGSARTPKFTSLLPTYDVAAYGAAFVALEVTDPVSLEKVNNIALVHA